MALAQDAEINMNVHVDDDDGAASTQIQINGTDGDMQGGSVRVRTSAGGAHVKVKVKGGMQEQNTVIIHEDAPPPGYQPPPPPPPSAYRDCGTGNDPGCTMMRDGKYAMDAETWRGFYKSLKSQPNEITRQEMSDKMIKRMYLTAAQLGLLLDLFPNEITRLEVAKVAAPHVVNPQHALGFSSKWDNSISAGEYTDLISEQQP
jgi:hypothetical protein